MSAEAWANARTGKAPEETEQWSYQYARRWEMNGGKAQDRAQRLQRAIAHLQAELRGVERAIVEGASR